MRRDHRVLESGRSVRVIWPAVLGPFAPALHLHPCCATSANLRHLEYFHDHVRIESMLFDGAATPSDGSLQPDLSRPGMGLEFKHRDAERFRIWSAQYPTN